MWEGEGGGAGSLVYPATLCLPVGICALSAWVCRQQLCLRPCVQFYLETLGTSAVTMAHSQLLSLALEQVAELCILHAFPGDLLGQAPTTPVQKQGLPMACVPPCTFVLSPSSGFISPALAHPPTSSTLEVWKSVGLSSLALHPTDKLLGRVCKLTPLTSLSPTAPPTRPWLPKSPLPVTMTTRLPHPCPSPILSPLALIPLGMPSSSFLQTHPFLVHRLCYLCGFLGGLMICYVKKCGPDLGLARPTSLKYLSCCFE